MSAISYNALTSQSKAALFASDVVLNHGEKSARVLVLK